MYLNFMFLDQFLFELSCKHTHTQTQSNELHNYNRPKTMVIWCDGLNLQYYAVITFMVYGIPVFICITVPQKNVMVFGWQPCYREKDRKIQHQFLRVYIKCNYNNVTSHIHAGYSVSSWIGYF